MGEVWDEELGMKDVAEFDNFIEILVDERERQNYKYDG